MILWKTGKSGWLARAGLVVVLAVQLACDASPGYLTLEGATMGTYYRVTARCPGTDQQAIRGLVEGTLEEVEQAMSTYRPGSELSRFNASGVGTRVPASPELLAVMEAARAIHRLSRGAFDVTVGPLVNLWGFGPDGAIRRAPGDHEVELAMARVGMDRVGVDTAHGVLEKRGDVYVDLSAIAKGYGVDRVSERLARQGCADVLVDVGGEVKGVGRHPSGRPWRVGIEVPDPETLGGIQRVVPLAGKAIATSGDYRNYLALENGQRVAHTIDPRTGRPVRHRLASVSVLHESAMWADGLATALNVLGPEAGWALAEESGLAAVLVIRDASGFQERYTPAMRNYLDSQP